MQCLTVYIIGLCTQVVAKSDKYCQAEQGLQAEVDRLSVWQFLCYVLCVSAVPECFRVVRNEMYIYYTIKPQIELQEAQKSLGIVRGEKIAAEQQNEATYKELKKMEVL